MRAARRSDRSRRRERPGRGTSPESRWLALAGSLVASAALSLAGLTSLRADDDVAWAFRAPGIPRPPSVEHVEWADNEVDRFLVAAWEARGIAPAPELSRRALLRRLTFDLTGLPPTPEALDAFEHDESPDALARVVDRLLASPRHGERWARHWLDVVRYADSDGFAIDSERPTLWRYRDWVIRSLNADMPFDEFARMQLAGDELVESSDGVVAAGFYRLGPWEADNMVAEIKRQDYLNEVTSAVGSAFLGLTLGCARCHDHKYDPLPTRDFYALQAFFTPLERSERPAALAEDELGGVTGKRKAEVDAEAAARREAFAAHRATLRESLGKHLEKPASEIDDKTLDEALGKDAPFTSDDKKRHAELKKAVDEFAEPPRYADVACSVANPPADRPAPATHVLLGGSVTARGDAVAPGFLTSVPPWDAPCYAGLSAAAESAAGRRTLLAKWIASAGNPLTARVIVNRIWQHHMGAGLVATPDDFGANGSGPSHPALLDFLATRLIEGGWRLAPIHRLIVLSRAYRLSSRHPDAARLETVDPSNRLLWRANRRRLEAETIRDAVLAVSGELSLAVGGPGFYAKLPDELGRNFPFFTWDPSDEETRCRRSIYMFQRRNMLHPLMEAFDGVDMTEPCARRGASVTTPQVFALFNSDFARDMSRRFALRVLRACEDDTLGHAFALALGRAPDDVERAACGRFIDEQRALHEGRRGETEGGLAGDLVAAFADLCLVLLNSNEFVYLE